MEENFCSKCIRDKGNECCRNVYIVLNKDELLLFENEESFVRLNNGGIYYNEIQCVYLGEDFKCKIHHKKPLYCKYYPVFITGKVFVDDTCPYSKEGEYSLTDNLRDEIDRLKEKYTIYKEEWFWDDIQKLLDL